jgi:predicted ribonuclease YlaK
MSRGRKGEKIILKSNMGLKNISSCQEIRAYVANKIVLPLAVLEALEKGKKVNDSTIAKAINELKSIAGYLDEKCTSKKK